MAVANITELTKHLAANIIRDNGCLYSRLIDSASLADRSYAR
jgi:hypothetical protein